MTRTYLAVFGILLASEAVLASPVAGYGGLGGFGGYEGYGGYGGFGGCGCGVEIAEPIIPVAGGLVDRRSYVDSYFPGSSYCGYGTYGPAYGGRGYPLELYGYPGPFRRGYGGALYY